MEKRIISFDIKANFGFLKKPDINDGIYLTYNCLHKPALLGILGAIIGLGGHYQSYSKKKSDPDPPEYFDKLGNVKVGIQPLNSFKGNFTKTVITYNNSVGYANLDGGTLIVTEQTLIKPSYRIYLLLDLVNEYEYKLFTYLINGEAEFIPYLGKNDFQLWWINFSVYDYEKYDYDNDYKIENLFLKEHIVKQIRDNSNRPRINPHGIEPFSIFFERLPVGFSTITTNYELEEFAFTNYLFPKEVVFENLFMIIKDGEKSIIQLN